MDSSPSRIRLSSQRLHELFADLQMGHGEALVSLLQIYRPYLLATAQARLEDRLKPKAGASDLVQEAIAEAHDGWQRLEQKPATVDEFRGWLRTLLLERFKALRRRYYRAQSRSLRRERPLDDGQSKALIDSLSASKSDSPSANFDRQLLSERLEEALRRLPAPYRKVIMWRNRDNRRFADIGDRMNRSPDAARMLWARAIRRLKRELESSDDDS
jgi:RNA polymerase sigma-70 factor (ECF subfamily)